MSSVSWLPVVVVALAGVVLVATGALLTDIGPWYRALRKPSWQPPDAAFGPAWTVIFFLMGVSAVTAWNAADAGGRTWIVAAFVVNAILNAAWSGLFFTLRRPDLALAEIALLWLSIVGIIAAVAPVSTLAAVLIAPYLAWVTFAAFLNYTIVRLNPRARPSAA